MRYYIYKMNILDNDTYFGSYIGQHKIGRKCPFNDGYKGSGREWKKYILDNHIPVEKTILRMCDSVEDANYWEKYYIESANAQGIYLWNRCKGGGGYDHNKVYTEEELKEHQKQYKKQYDEVHKEQKKKYQKQYMKQWREINKEKRTEYNKQYDSQLCNYNGKILTFNALRKRFRRMGIEHTNIEAKKYLTKNND